MKEKALFIATTIFFLLVNTNYYWGNNLGMYAMLNLLLLALCFFVLTLFLIGQTFVFVFNEKFKNRNRLLLIGFMTTVLALTFLFPGGLINFDKFERDNILIAEREGAANCSTTLKLKDDNTFIETNVCFGVSETTGTYKIKGDTIFFENVSLGRQVNDFYQFAVVKKGENENEKHLGDIVRYKNYSDTSGMPLWIIKNDLTK